VSLWRKLYNGVPDGKGNLVRYSLEEAAHKVGISKKSLDDYLLQLRLGRKHGFNFNEHKDDKVGILRSFVRIKRKETVGGVHNNDDKNSDGLKDEDITGLTPDTSYSQATSNIYSKQNTLSDEF